MTTVVWFLIGMAGGAAAVAWWCDWLLDRELREWRHELFGDRQ